MSCFVNSALVLSCRLDNIYQSRGWMTMLVPRVANLRFRAKWFLSRSGAACSTDGGR